MNLIVIPYSKFCKKFEPVVVFNSRLNAQKLFQIKHLIDILPIDKCSSCTETPAEHLTEKDYDKTEFFGLRAKFDPEVQLKDGPDTKSCVDKNSDLEITSNDDFVTKWALEERTVLKRLRMLKDKSLLFKEYYPTRYRFNDRANTVLKSPKGEVDRRAMF